MVNQLARLDGLEGIPSHNGLHCVSRGHQMRTVFLSIEDTQDRGELSVIRGIAAIGIKVRVWMVLSPLILC